MAAKAADHVGSREELEVSVEAGNLADDDAMRLDDDGRPRRTGTVWTASAHIITAVIGAGVLSLAWAMAQLGWAVGTAMMLLFAGISYYTSTLLAECYHCGAGDPESDAGTGKRNYTYTEAVRSILGGAKVRLCGVIQYANLVGIAIGYTIAASIVGTRRSCAAWNANTDDGAVTVARARAETDVKLTRKMRIRYCQRYSPLSPLFMFI
ncbi:unnamed protein product [Miscanthus lutarioriparius]|uniref:Amino acid transporter transmembrane domain-containing protein n=1 Tax=Miscanthus lutarioriparius TaxID=422564 RepID=A0A811QE49_9POAL|nr:unnamed protein product [Miscanthus lutarioriparius]